MFNQVHNRFSPSILALSFITAPLSKSVELIKQFVYLISFARFKDEFVGHAIILSCTVGLYVTINKLMGLQWRP